MIVGGTGNHAQMLGAALQGLEAQRQAAEHNIANVETAGYLARRVSFEDSLRSAIAANDVSQTRITTSFSHAPARLDGSNVELEDEVTSLELNSLQQQLVTTALNQHYMRVRTALGG